ncbi:MAG: efflux RND transporter permease subunit [Balneolales bacterium]
MRSLPIKPGFVGVLLKRPVTIVMVTLLIVAFGLFSLNQLKVTLLPSITIPVVAVSISYSDVPPEDMTRLIVRPVEGVLSGIEGVESMDANVNNGSVFIILRLQPGLNVRHIELDVREAIDGIRNSLPRDASDPAIFQFDPESFPIMRMSLEGSNRGLDELRNLATETIEPQFERLEGVAAVDTYGGLERTVYVDLDRMDMSRHQVSPEQIQEAIRSNNTQVPIGNLVVDRRSYSVRAQSLYQDIDAIRNTIVNIDDEGHPVRVEHVANVEDTFAEISSFVEVNGSNSVTLGVQKQSDANTLDVTSAVHNEIHLMKERLPPGVSLQVLSDEGEIIETSITNLSDSAIQALVLVVIMLLIFLGGWRSSLVVSLSIPVTIAGTFAAMSFTGITLNIMSITGLALAIGLLVDNSIVVLDSIVNKLEEGKSTFKAALEGTNEVKDALLGSTLTTLAVFIPILGIDGFTGQIATDLALTICLAISISFVTSIILIPVFASLLLSNKSSLKKNLTLRTLSGLEDIYISSLKWLLHHKYLGFLAFIGIMISIFSLNKFIDTEYFPGSDSGQININIELPAGSKLDNTTEVMRDISQRIMEFDAVKTVITYIGQSGRASDTNRGRISINMIPEDQREITSDDLALELRNELVYPEVNLQIRPMPGGMRMGGGGSWGDGDIRVSLIGPDTGVLQEYSERIEHILMEDTTVISVDISRNSERPELLFLVDRLAVNRMGTSFNDVANTFGMQSRGSLVGEYINEGREIPIQLRLDESYRMSQQDLLDLDVFQVNDQRITASSVGQFVESQSLARIFRRDRETLLDINISVTGTPAEHRQHIMYLFEEAVVLPDGYRYAFTGSTTDEEEGMNSLVIALLMALLLTYMVMAALFENFRDPFVIMFTIPLGFFGSYVMLYITGFPFSVAAGIGMVILVGIVVNNGIVLVDFIHQNTKYAGNDTYADTFLKAAKRRFRPIMLTALTTIGSMLPLALQTGMGSETWGPLALTVIGGLISATIITLYIIPVILISISKERRKAFSNQS